MSEKPPQLENPIEEPTEQPRFERPPIPVFGKVSEGMKTKISRELGRRFSGGEFTEITEDQLRRINESEQEKTQFEKEVVAAANIAINKMREKYGLAQFDVPEKNIHILPSDIYHELSKAKDSRAIHQATRQLIIADAEKIREKYVSTAVALFHEILHLKGFVSIDVKADGKEMKQRRIGLMVFEGYAKSDKDEWYKSFEGINEAIVQEITERNKYLILRNSSDPKAKEELEWLNSPEAIEIKKGIVKSKIPERNESEALEEIEWVDKEGGYNISSYRVPRRVLKYICEEIALEDNTESEKIMDIFFKAHFTGNLLEIARLVERTFGEGSFRVLGSMRGEVESARLTLDYLRKQRIRIKKDREKPNDNGKED